IAALRRRAPVHQEEVAGAAATAARGSLGVSSNALMALLCVAGVACCVAMAMPQVHIVAYCSDLGYGAAPGGEMLGVMMFSGLFQGGLVPMYAIIVREYFSPQEAGTRLGIVLMATLGGMALGGWMSGAIFDYSGSYRAAFLNGMIWNLLNAAIVLWLLTRS